MGRPPVVQLDLRGNASMMQPRFDAALRQLDNVSAAPVVLVRLALPAPEREAVERPCTRAKRWARARNAGHRKSCAESGSTASGPIIDTLRGLVRAAATDPWLPRAWRRFESKCSDLTARTQRRPCTVQCGS